jgi:hypothetical protein
MTNLGGHHCVCVFVEKKEKGRIEGALFIGNAKAAPEL